ncbi:hypothetical protein BLOT_016507 [Blomia tropicalis]|nr:hypothetical protein BLOT_016507 [Blomia tropicalis]
MLQSVNSRVGGLILIELFVLILLDIVLIVGIALEGGMGIASRAPSGNTGNYHYRSIFIMSQAWEYFEKVFENNKVIGAKCKICNKKLSPNTSGMKFHAISFHQIKISLGQTLHNIDQQPTMKNYFPSIEKDSLKNLLSRLCAKDGLPFSILASSEDIRKGMAKLGFDLPKSTETIRKHILEFADDPIKTMRMLQSMIIEKTGIVLGDYN